MKTRRLKNRRFPIIDSWIRFFISQRARDRAHLGLEWKLCLKHAFVYSWAKSIKIPRPTNRAFLCIRIERESDRKEIPCLAIFSIEEFIDRFIKCENTSFFKFILPLSSNFKRIFFLYFFSIKNYLYYYIRSIKFILKNVIGIFIFIMLPFIICNSLLLLDSK